MNDQMREQNQVRPIPLVEALRLLTHDDIQTMLDINKDAVYALFKRGFDGHPDGIKAFKLRGRWRCTVEAYKSFIAYCEENGVVLSEFERGEVAV